MQLYYASVAEKRNAILTKKAQAGEVRPASAGLAAHDGALFRSDARRNDAQWERRMEATAALAASVGAAGGAEGGSAKKASKKEKHRRVHTQRVNASVCVC